MYSLNFFSSLIVVLVIKLKLSIMKHHQIQGTPVYYLPPPILIPYPLLLCALYVSCMCVFRLVDMAWEVVHVVRDGVTYVGFFIRTKELVFLLVYLKTITIINVLKLCIPYCHKGECRMNRL